MRKTAVLLLVALAGGIAIGADQRAPDWQLVKTGDGVRAYAKIQEGSDVHEYRALTIVSAKIETVAQIIRDVPNYPEWMAFCSSGRILKRFDENNMIVHMIMDFPVVPDRDLVVKADTVYDLSKARGVVSLSLLRDSAEPVPPGIVRMAEFTGTFQFDFITREKTGVIFTFRANPGGHIPPFVINIFSKHLLFDTLQNLKNRMVQLERYRIAAEKSNDRVLFEGILGDREKVRSVIKARMKEHYLDYRSVDKLLVHNEVMESFLTGDATRLTELVFNSLGSRSMLLEAAGGAIGLMLSLATRSDEQAVIMGDTSLASRLIDGTRPEEKCVYDIVRQRAGDTLKAEFRNGE